jgi:hypothetical protein
MSEETQETRILEAPAEGAVLQSERLSRTTRLRLAWALFWPCATLDLVWHLLRSQLRLAENQLGYIDAIVALLFFFFFSTWVVRRTVRLDFPEFHVAVIHHHGGPETSTMTYRESVSVAWLICWRSAVVVLIVAFLLAVVLRLRYDLNGAMGWLWPSAAEFLIFYFWIIKAMVRKKYAGFSLRLDKSVI